MITPLTHKRQTADKMLAYLKQHNIISCPNTYKMLCQISEAIGEELPILWKSYELLRIMARLELNSSNGRKGFRVLCFDPLAANLPDRPNIPICEVNHCPILRALKKRFPEITTNGSKS